jgi:polyisoprenoid-binding protein YceI
MTNSTFDPATTVIENITGDYTIDASHSRLGFSARHAMVTTVRGAFTDFEGTAHVDTATPANSRVDLTIKSASIDTSVADRDAHLRSADFFESESYPDITFTSTDVERDGDDWTITGDLTIKGTTKPISIEFESTGSARDPFGNMRIGFEGHATLSRKDWGLSWNAALETGGFLVSDKIKLDFDISAIAR